MFLSRPLVIHFAAVTASLIFAPFVHAQCIPDWVPGQAYPGTYGGGASDAVLWDPDGPGPEPEMLVITGEFDAVGGVLASNLAAWDGTQWRALADGFGEGYFEDSFGECWSSWGSTYGVYNDELYAGVSSAGCCPRCGSGMDLLRWDGSVWQSIGGVAGLGRGGISALRTFEGELVVAGYFESIDGVPAHNIARWNGQEWRPLGVSPGDGVDGAATELLLHDGRLIVAGSFTSAGGVLTRNIASWDGEQWRALGTGLGGEYGGISVLAVYNDEIVAGGYFNAASGDPEYIARWDGTQWQPLGAGLDGPESTYVYSLSIYAGELVVGGYFEAAGSVPARGSAAWNGVEWRAWGAGMDSVYAFGVYQGSLLAAGSLSTPGGQSWINTARWDGAAWHFFGDGLTRPVTVLTSYNNELIGAMDAYVSNGWYSYWYLSACNVGLPGIVSRWDGQCWDPLETRDPADRGAITAMTSFGSDLVVGGLFATMDGVPAANVARWDGTQWHALGDGLGVPNGSVDPIVRALAVYEGQLIAGGTFRTTGAAPVERVARWDGAQWQPMGAGFPNSFPGSPFVAALVVHNGTLFAGGRFDFGGLRAGVARWDPTASVWVPIDQLETINDIVWALAVYGNDLIAAGWVGAAFLYIARWDGSEWHALGDGLGFESQYPSVQALAVAGTDLVVGGRFAFADGAPVNNIARWDGTQWHAMGAGVTLGFADPDPYGGAAVYALALHADSLVVGGNFLFAGDHASAYFAQWRCPPCPGDLNGDGGVSLQDLAILLAHFGGSGDPSDGDFDADGDVDLNDLAELLSNFGTTCP